MDCIHALNIPHTLLLYEGQYPKISKPDPFFIWKVANQTRKTGTLSSP